MRIGLAADHAGFALKNELADWLRQSGHDTVDFGPEAYVAGDDYPDYVGPLAEATARGEVERGVAICGSGVGACVVANKVPGVRAGICHDTYSAHQGVEHDEMNVLVLGARIIGSALARDIVRAYVDARFTAEERHIRRLKKLASLETRYQNLNRAGQK